ncbi:hypothetical protein QQ045_005810 [Rhodiola kirilowii]
MEESRDETQGKIRKRVFSSSSSSLVRKNRFKRAILIGKRVGSGTPVTTPTMTMSRSPVFGKATEFVNERDGVVSVRRLAASLWGMNEVSSPKAKKESSRVVCSSNPEFKDARKALSTAKELVKVLTHILRQEEKHYSSSSAKSLVSALRFELDRASAQVDQLAYAQRLHRREMKHLAAEKNKSSRAVEMLAAELEAERKLRKQADRMNRKLGRELADGRARLDKVVIELENERRPAKAVLELKNVEKERDHHMLHQLGDVERVDQIKVQAEAKYHSEEKNAELEAYMSNDGVEAESPGSANTEILRDFLRKTLGKVCQNPNVIEAENEDCWDESDMHLMELEKDESEKSYKWAYSLHDDDSRRSSVEVFKGRKSLSEKIQWATISLLKGS